MSKTVSRHFSREFKLQVIERMEAGASATGLSRELSIKRTLLYRWRDAFRSGGELALRSRRGRPTKSEALAMQAARGPSGEARDLAEARSKIAELERKVGQQQVDLDFFKQALRHVEGSRRPSDRSGATASSPASKR